ncbi:RluA family pseudouridine synthase [Hyphomicrobium sp. 802]|uniref:RluA family pseudouridine synthase n=1 Tax=Hyphomicrobium sp. 802 TaxID=1112272 RepID=UPI0004A23098|nr:RluA family pseudouridine synthase [Hyphomicrobium sp. 802]
MGHLSGFLSGNHVSIDEKTTSHIDVVAGPEDAGQRVDRWLATKIEGISRARVQALIRDGHVSAGDTIRELRTPVKPGLTYTVSIPPAEDSGVKGEEIALHVVYEDDNVIVIDKPAGLVVHPSAGHDAGTLVNALIAHCGDSLSGIGGVKRPGIVHRLDKDTSGLLVVAKSDAAHQGLAEQFKSHGRDGRLHRSYLAFVWGRLPKPAGSIDARLARSRTNRLKIAVTRGEEGREAKTHYEVLDVFPGETPSGDISLLRLVLETGRTHQIRVHLAHIGHPVVGDPTYGAGFKTRLASVRANAKDHATALMRQALHAERLQFEHPITDKKLNFYSKLPLDLERLGEALRPMPSVPTDKRRRRRS